MAPKYTPLDLSFLANQYSPQRNSIANTAALIMANAGWGPSQAALAEQKKASDEAEKRYKSAHKQSFLSSVFDLLQTPLYGVANAMDEALAGHQSDSHDSVLEDIAKTAGGIGTGLARGIGAGLRGSSGLLDVLPGVDINDEWQSDPTDKTHFSDVAIRKATGMATADAAQNWDTVRPKLEKLQKKSLWDKTAFELMLPDNLDSPDAQEEYFRNQMLTGIPVDIAGDPLNLLLGGAPTAAKAASKGLTEGLDAARATRDFGSAIKTGLGSKAARQLEAKGSLNLSAPVGAIAESLPGGAKFGVADVGPIGTKDYKTLANLGRRETPQRGPMAISSKNQKDLAKRIVNVASSGDPQWLYKAADMLRAHPNVSWDETEKLLARANGVIKKIGHRGVKGLAPALRERIAADAEASRPALEVERRVSNEVGQIGGEVAVTDGQIVKSAAPRPMLKKSEAIVANRTIGKFENEILGRKSAPGTGEGLVRAIAAGDNVRYSGPQQARMWNHINTLLTKIPPKYRYKQAARILRTVENYFITKGMIPHSWSALNPKDGLPGAVPLRLSQIAEAIGPENLGNSHAFITGILRGDPKALAQLSEQQIEAINALKQSEAIAAAPATQKGLQQADIFAEGLNASKLSVARKQDQFNRAIKQLGEFTIREGGGEAGAKVVQQYMSNLLGKSDPINKALNANRLKTTEWLAKTGRPGARHFMVNDPSFVQSVTRAISEAAHLPTPKSLSTLWGPAARIEDWIGARFNAAYGVQDMRPIYLREQASAMSTTGRRAKLINELGRRFDTRDADLWHEAFVAAQKNGVTDGRVHELQQELQAAMENLFGGTGLRNGAIADSTIVGRNRLLMDELNKNLTRFGLGKHQFSNGAKVKDAAGVEHDFSNGLDWMKSWEAWDVKNPYEFLHRVQNAIEHTVREKVMFDEIVSRFASPVKKGGVKYGIDHPRLRGFYFTSEGARQAKVFADMLEDISTPSSKTLQYFDHVLSKLKASLTIYIPGHHMTNMIGDVYYNWIAGVNKPIRYDQATRVMLAQKGRYGTFADFDKLTGPKALEQAIARGDILAGKIGEEGAALGKANFPAAGSKVIITMKNGTKVTADMIYVAADRLGILPTARVLEDVSSDVTSVLDKFRPMRGMGQRTVHQVSEIRDHIPRLAQFIDGIAKHPGSFQKAIESSAALVRKWHPDGLDVTKFEKNFMKRVFPFYSWTRKAIPLAIESVVFAGPKVMAYPRLMEAIGLANGVDPQQQISDPFPSDQLFPDWLRDRGIGPIGGGPGGYTVINPSTPILDTLTLLGHPGQSSIDMLNPMMKVPVEAAQGQTLGRNVPIGNTTQNWVDYATKQIPIASQLGRASGQFGVSDSTKAEGFPNWTNILNLISGAKKVDTGKYIKSGQFDVRDYLRQLKENGR